MASFIASERSAIYVDRRLHKANYLLVQNIRALLARRGDSDRALAMWCGHRPAWLSKILTTERGIKLKDLDKIADFFGLTVAQLFQEGISPLTERRRAERRMSGERRGGRDRRQPDRSGALHPELQVRFPAAHRDRADDGDRYDDDDDPTKPRVS